MRHINKSKHETTFKTLQESMTYRGKSIVKQLCKTNSDNYTGNEELLDCYDMCIIMTEEIRHQNNCNRNRELRCKINETKTEEQREVINTVLFVKVV
jgi:hypothetical protein